MQEGNHGSFRGALLPFSQVRKCNGFEMCKSGVEKKRAILRRRVFFVFQLSDGIDERRVIELLSDNSNLRDGFLEGCFVEIDFDSMKLFRAVVAKDRAIKESIPLL